MQINRREFLSSSGTAIFSFFFGEKKVSGNTDLYDEVSEECEPNNYGDCAYGSGHYGGSGHNSLEDFCDAWLTNDEYWDVNKDKIVNFKDYAVLTK